MPSQAEALSAEPRPAPRQNTQDAERIGDILRRVREHRREDLEEISDYLRIRPAYLYALEQSRYEDLPADAYVIGFLRSYAAYLGLDGRGAIDQYRREMAGARRKPQLSMPQPMPEGRAPTITVIVGAVIAALVVYLAWYTLSSPSTEALQKPATLPVTKQEEPATTQAPEPSAPAIASADQGTASLPQTATSEGIALGVTAASTALQSVPTAQTTQAPATPESKKAEALAAQLPVQQPDKEVKEQAATTPAAPPAETKPAQTPEAAPEATPEAQPQAASYGEKTGKSRVVIKAEKESWILVTDSKGNTVFDKTLKAGETYNVPTGKGLKLTTGNTSGVAFMMDGGSLPKLKTNGKVARAVPLEPEKLKARLSGAEPQDTSTEETDD